MSLREDLLDCVDSTLEIRQDICAQIADVFLVTRTWSGERPGDGEFEDDETILDPMPSIKDFSHDVRLRQGGSVKQGDLFLIGLSQNKYPNEDDIRTDTRDKNVEKFYRIEAHYYRVINIRKRLVTWNVHIRKRAQDETERR